MRCAFKYALGPYFSSEVHSLRLASRDGCALSRDCLNCRELCGFGRNRDRKIGNSAIGERVRKISRTGCCPKADQRDVAPSALARVDGGVAATVTHAAGADAAIWE